MSAKSCKSIKPTSSPRKINANRRNARKSTGPKTPQGKLVSSQNAITHGLHCARRVLLPGESKAEFLLVREGFIDSLEPMNAAELFLVERITLAEWKLQRLHRTEQQLHQDFLDGLNTRAANHLRRLEEDMNEDLDDDKMVDYSPWYDGWGEEPNPDRRSSDRPVEELDRSANTLIDWIDRLRDDRMPVASIQARRLTERTGIPQYEWLAKQEQRLENSIHRNMRELDRMRETAYKRAKRQREEDDGGEVKRSPYRCNMKGLVELAERDRLARLEWEEDMGHCGGDDDDAEIQNKATDDCDAAKDSQQEELATDGARMNTDKVQGNARDADIQVGLDGNVNPVNPDSGA
jgi:hypothetical protein